MALAHPYPQSLRRTIGGGYRKAVYPLRESAEREEQAAQVAARPTAASSLPAVARVLALQQSAGNPAACRMLQGESAAVADKEKTKRPAGKRPKATGTSTAAQQKGEAPNAYGELAWDITKAAGNNGCDVQISFKAFSPEVDATKIAIIQ